MSIWNYFGGVLSAMGEVLKYLLDAEYHDKHSYIQEIYEKSKQKQVNKREREEEMVIE